MIANRFSPRTIEADAALRRLWDAQIARRIARLEALISQLGGTVPPIELEFCAGDLCAQVE